MIRLTNIAPRKKVKSLLTIALLLLFSLTQNSLTVTALTQAQKDAIKSGALYFNTEEDICASQSSSASPITSQAGTAYFIGDSIGRQVQSPLTSSLTSKGWTFKGNSADGRNLDQAITLVTSNNEVKTDVQNSNAVVIELGTNSAGFTAANVREMVSKVRGLAPSANIYWIDTAAVRDANLAQRLSTVNGIIHGQASSNNYNVISWNKKVFGDSANPENINPNAPDNGYIRPGDTVHLSESGITAYAEMVSSALGGSSSSAPTSAATSAECYNPCACGEAVPTTGPPQTLNDLNQILQKWASEHSVARLAVRDLTNDRNAAVNGGSTIQSASVYKLFVAQALYRLRADGDLSFNATVNFNNINLDYAKLEDSRDGTPYPWGNRMVIPINECLPAMISNSENACGMALKKLVIDRGINRFGESTTLDPQRVTANDAVTLLQQIARGNMVNQQSSSELEGLLMKQTHRNKIPAGIPNGVRVGNKTGELWRAEMYDGNTYSNDVAIVRADNLNYVIAVLTTLDPASDSDNSAIADLSRQVYEFLTRGSTTSGSGSGGCDPSNFTGSNNAQTTWNYFRGKGLSPVQTAAIMGNFSQESSFNPKRVQGDPPYDSETLVPGKGYGIAQWTDSGRQQNLITFTANDDRNRPIYDLTLQLDFAYHEMTDRSPDDVWEHLKTFGDNQLAEATRYFHDSFEGSADDEDGIQERIDDAIKYLALYGNSGPSGGGSGSCPPGGTGTSPDGFVFPLRTTQTLIRQGVNGSHWCIDRPTNCHHDYNAADIFVETGTPVLAVRDGTIVNIRSGPARLVLLASNGRAYYYTHMRAGSITVPAGRVTAGQVIGAVGTDADGEGIRHLHIDELPNPPYSYRPGCANAACQAYPFINIQPELNAAFHALPP